jgi:very-short-patch-repair endonuclease
MSEEGAVRSWGRPEATASVAMARKLRKQLTRQEAKLWLRLRALPEQGYHFRRQVPIGPFIVDFACLRHSLVVEIDGGQHSLARAAARDRARDTALGGLGFEVLRFWNAEVDENADGVVETVFAHLTRGPGEVRLAGLPDAGT